MNDLTQPPNQGFHKVIKNEESGTPLEQLLKKADFGKMRIRESAQEKPLIAYEALYCPCIHESGYCTISIHKTKDGATQAVIDSMLEEFEKFKELMKADPKFWKLEIFAEHENWNIVETEILD